ncbi:MAG: hypothetical protein ACREAG_00955, partial [Nitrosopumilaceae archaeon]
CTEYWKRCNIYCNHCKWCGKGILEMAQINTSIDDELLKEFRHIVYNRMGLKKGDLKTALEDAMFDYIHKYPDSDKTKGLAKRV